MWNNWSIWVVLNYVEQLLNLGGGSTATNEQSGVK